MIASNRLNLALPFVLMIVAAAIPGCVSHGTPPWLQDASEAGDESSPVRDVMGRDESAADVNAGRDGWPDTAGSDGTSPIDAQSGDDRIEPADHGIDSVSDETPVDGESDYGYDVPAVDADGFDPCAGRECGDDPVFGVPCGECGIGKICSRGRCGEWEPDDYSVSCKNDMCFVPGGAFWMGGNKDLDDDTDFDEFPYRQVTVPAFFIDKYEVTVEAYMKCVDAGVCILGSQCPEILPDCFLVNWDKPDRGQYPMNDVPWEWARDYCQWVGKRLPTEAEWEKAARGTDGRVYPWGNEPPTCELAVLMDDGIGCGAGSSVAVGSRPSGASPYGVMDMAGNVWEHVYDWYRVDFYSVGTATNPDGPDSGAARVVRGGAFNYPLHSLRVSDRDRTEFNSSPILVGFRCAKDAADGANATGANR